MTIISIYKEKNLVYFQTEKHKTYKYDISNGDFIGLSGKPIVTIPYNELCRALRVKVRQDKKAVFYTLLNNFSCRQPVYKYTFIQAVQLADKLDSVSWQAVTRVTPQYVSVYENNKKTFIDYFRQNPTHSLEDFLNYKDIMLWEDIFKTYNITETRVKEKMLSIINGAFSQITDDIQKFIKHAIKYYFTKPMIEYLIVRQTTYYLGRINYSAFLREIYDISKKMEITIKDLPTYDLLTSHSILCRDYILRKNEILNKEIKKHQEARNLFFEDDRYIVIVPKTTIELIKEGQAQDNCVGGYGKSVADGRRNVVFIRDKSNISKSLVTCDIAIQTGNITQYLMAYNRSVTDQSLLDFKFKYQEYLHSIWQ